MDKQVSKLPATADPAMQEVLSRSFADLAGQFARRTNQLSQAIENQKHESPLLVTTIDSGYVPAEVAGMLWFIVSPSMLCYYDIVQEEFIEVSLTQVAGNNNVVSLGGGAYALSRLIILAPAFLEAVNVTFFSPGAIQGTLEAYEVGGSSLGSASFNFSSANHRNLNKVLNLDVAANLALEIRVTLTSGSLPETAAYATVRRKPF